MPFTICQHPSCGKEFWVKPSYVCAKYCSMVCYRTRAGIEMLTLICENPLCQQPFSVVASLYYRKHCSKPCYTASHHVELVCQNSACGRSFSVTTHRQKQAARYYSHACYSTANTRNIAERFWEKVLISPDGCWLWQGYKDKNGYGVFAVRKKVRAYAHHMAYELTHGPVPQGIFVCHDCPGGDNPACVRPDHMFLGTPKDNTQDAMTKGKMTLGFLHNPPQGELNGHARFSNNDVLYIRSLEGQESARVVAQRFDTIPAVIYQMWKRVSWKHLP